MENQFLTINNLYLQFEQSPYPLFANLNMQLQLGKLHGLRGKNGSGKSTLLSLLSGRIDSSMKVGGSVTIVEQTFKLGEHQALQKMVGVVPQHFDRMIADQFTFAENLRFAGIPQCPSLFRFFKHTPEVPAFMVRFGIDLNTPVRLLSGGQRQILALLMALQKHPSLILLDEPTATLDPINAQLVFEFMRTLMAMEKVTVLVISHDHELLANYCTGSIYELHVDQEGQRSLVLQSLFKI